MNRSLLTFLLSLLPLTVAQAGWFTKAPPTFVKSETRIAAVAEHSRGALACIVEEPTSDYIKYGIVLLSCAGKTIKLEDSGDTVNSKTNVMTEALDVLMSQGFEIKATNLNLNKYILTRPLQK